jgi:hypothetical protein
MQIFKYSLNSITKNNFYRLMFYVGYILNILKQPGLILKIMEKLYQLFI